MVSSPASLGKFSPDHSMARYQPKDRLFHKAKALGLRARSAFKLAELLDRAGVGRLTGAAALDLGAAPGAWLQILARLVGPRGRVVGVDLVEILPVGPNVHTFAADAREPATLDRLRLLAPERFALVTSDMAPKTTGIHGVDCARSLELVAAALGVSVELLAPGGTLFAKVFMGQDLGPFVARELKPRFASVRQLRPEATREGSREIYLVGKGFQPTTR